MINYSLLENAYKVFRIKSISYYFNIFLTNKCFIFGNIPGAIYISFR